MFKVLIVDDNEMNRDMLGRRLRREGFSIYFAVDGPNGVAIASQEIPDIILMDVSLGDMDGWEATQLIKSDPKTVHIPIIALTAQTQPSDRTTSIAAGCCDFDTKPIDLPRLLAKIKTALEQSRCAARN